ncbi:MAG: hypothetical protein K8T25_10290 [Planctomycetia bacterium]|nr:hypothetical protein [Planctomycetia bacterium]
MVALSFRLNTDHEANSEYRYSIADWKHYALLANEKAFNQAREYASRVYAAASSPGRARENAHLIYHAAAEALLNPRVARRLVALDIYAPTYGKPDFPAGTFEYVVVDEDKAFRANYCDIVLAQRLTQRLLEKRANRTKKRTKNTRR